MPSDIVTGWGPRVPRVHSINVSGHKYGLVYPGVGWVVWRDAASLPEDLVFRVNYLGGQMPTFALNFSRPGAQVVAQYYNFLRLGREGYRRVQQDCRDTADWLAEALAQLGPFRLVSRELGIPAVAVALADPAGAGFSVYDVSDALRAHGWLVPAYTMPPGMQDVAVLRVVVRNGFSRDLAGMLLDAVVAVVDRLQGGAQAAPAARTGFHH